MCVRVCLRRRLSHCKLVQLYGVCTQNSPMCLVFEFMENGCLSEYLRSKKRCLSQDVMLGMCLDVSEGMAYLESSNFIHRDLVNQRMRTFYDTLLNLGCVGPVNPSSFLFLLQAARNCLVSRNNEVKVSDFGMTRYAFHTLLSLILSACTTMLCGTFESHSGIVIMA